MTINISAVSGAVSAARLLAAPEVTELNISQLCPDSDPETGRGADRGAVLNTYVVLTV